MPSKTLSFISRIISWPLCLAIALSLLLHLYLIGGLNFILSPLEMPEPPVEVRLMDAAPSPLPKKDPISKLRQAKPEQTRKKRDEIKPIDQPPVAQQSQPAETPQQADNTHEATPATQEPQQVQQVEEGPPATNAHAADVAEVKHKPATYVETDFRAYSGGTKGQVQVRYQVKPDGSYVLKSTMQVNGFAGLFFGALTQTSVGQVTDRGLKPLHYLYQYGNSESKARRASFDWAANQLTMEAGKRSITVGLTEGTQDLLSFLYQFMFVPPLESMQLNVTDGRRLRHFNYSFEGEEDVETDIGKLRSLHLGKSSGDTEEKTEVWLAIEYNYLPVKIRKTEKDGTVIEQVATRIASDMFEPH